MNSFTPYLAGELHKVNSRTVLLAAGLFMAAPFLGTLSMVIAKREMLAAGILPYESIAQNIYGAWSALLYPLLCLILVQSVTLPEQETNSLRYLRSTAIRWRRFFVAKCIYVYAGIVVVSLVNTVLTSATLSYVASLQGLDYSGGHIFRQAATAFAGMAGYCLPLVACQMVVCLLSSKAYLSFTLGLVLLVVGIPIVNLTDFVYNPYTLLIAAEKHGYLYPQLFLYATVLVAGAPWLFGWLTVR